MFRLDGKTAIVTGGGSGIGQAIRELFAKQGAKVAVLDISESAGHETASRIEAAGGKALVYGADVTKADQLANTFDAVLRDTGRLDILINNAGIAHVGTVETTSEADFDRVMAVNVKGAFLAAKTAVERMVPRGGGVIVNTASIASLFGVADRFVYSVSKGAILTMTYSIAIDYVKKGIRCNCVAPARIHTPFVDGFVKKNYPGKEDEMLRKLSDYQPIGRMGRPDEVAAMALYLCSDEASFITGQCFPIDGGVEKLILMKRVGVTIGLRKEALDEYKRIHVKLWPEIEGAIKEAGLRNYSIFYNDGQLFGYFEHPGPDAAFAAAMKKLAEAPRMREWWSVTEPLQVPRADRKPGDWWTTMEEVFHLD